MVTTSVPSFPPSESGASPGQAARQARAVRRVRAITRDEGRLREALAAQERRRFDATAAMAVRERTEDLLETLGAIAHDEDFWQRLGETGRPLDEDHLTRLRAFDELPFGVLLEASG